MKAHFFAAFICSFKSNSWLFWRELDIFKDPLFSTMKDIFVSVWKCFINSLQCGIDYTKKQLLEESVTCFWFTLQLRTVAPPDLGSSPHHRDRSPLIDVSFCSELHIPPLFMNGSQSGGHCVSLAPALSLFKVSTYVREDSVACRLS